jgi:hypothetical protein
MLNAFRLTLCQLACLALLSPIPAAAQQAPETAPAAPIAPVPPAIFTAKTAFVSNAGADSGLFPHPFSGDPDRAYNQFYAALQDWGRYNLVTAPDAADLVLELRLFAPNGPTTANKQKGASDPLPMFRLTVIDRKSHYTLWALTESIDPANLQKTHDRNFDVALATLALDLRRLATKSPPTAASSAIPH